MGQSPRILKGQYHTAVKINELELYASLWINFENYSVKWRRSSLRSRIIALHDIQNLESNSIYFYEYIHVCCKSMETHLGVMNTSSGKR